MKEKIDPRIAEYSRRLKACEDSITDDMVCPSHGVKLRPAVVKVLPSGAVFEPRCFDCLATPNVDPGSTRFT